MFNIIIFPGWFPSECNPLNGNFTKKHVDIISKNHKVAVAYADKSLNNDILYNLVVDERNAYPIVICYYKTSKLPVIHKFINYYRKLVSYSKAFNKAKSYLNDLDFIHVHVVTRDTILPLYYKWFKNIPYFISEHSSAYIRNQSSSILEKSLKRLIINNCEGLSAVSNTLKLAMEHAKLRHRNSQIIYNVVDSNVFNVKSVKKSDKIKFLHVSSLDEQPKNTIGILKVFERLYKIYPNIELHVVGGQLNKISESQTFAENLKSKHAIFYHGMQFGPSIVDFYHQSDYLVMFSNYETQGIVAIEALFCGLPVLATDLPSLNEYLHSKNSLLAKPKDEDGLFKNMEICILGKYEFWNSDDISNEVKENFNSKNISKRFDDFYAFGLNN
jgi:L-malate glycosyltransferase